MDTQTIQDNSLSSAVKFQRIVIATIGLAYAFYSATRDDFFLPSKHGPGVHFHGAAAYLLECMMLAVAGACLTPLLGLDETRRVKPAYEKIRRYWASVAWGLMGLGICINIIHPTLEPESSIASWVTRDLLWLFVGFLFSLLGKLPPSYLKKRKTASSIDVSPLGYARAFGAVFAGVLAFLAFIIVFFIAVTQPASLISLSLDFILFWSGVLLVAALSRVTYLLLRADSAKAGRSVAVTLTSLLAIWCTFLVCTRLMISTSGLDSLNRNSIVFWSILILALGFTGLTPIIAHPRR